MSKKQLVTFIICTLMSLCVLVALYGLSPLSKKIYHGGFERVLDRDLIKKSELDLDFNSFYLAGMSGGKIYLGNVTAPLHLLIVNAALTDTQHVRLTVRLDSVQDPKRFRLLVDSPYFFMTHGLDPQILRGSIGNWVAGPIMRDSGFYFVEALPISATTLALRSYNSLEKGYELAKKDIDSLHFHNDLLEKQVDGLFCVDGRLHYSKRLNRLVYLYFYRNEYTVADTSLSLKYRAHTIDTFRHAMIKVASLKNGTESVLSAPPVQINGFSCVDGMYLYVQSAVLARNQNTEDILTSSIIDVYNLETGKYTDSFLIPNHQGQPIRSFQVANNRVYALFGNYIVAFEFAM